MSRNIVILLDGTGNEVQRAGGDTNVLRLHHLLEHNRPSGQVAYYSPGVGTFSIAGAWTPWAKWFTRMSGMAFGLGLQENLIAAYTFLVRNWKPGDRIFILGFSRGAYSASVLASVVFQVGILRPDAENLVSRVVENVISARGRRMLDEELHAYEDERSTIDEEAADTAPTDSWRVSIRKHFGVTGLMPVRIHFIGLWDSVNAIGFLRRHKTDFTYLLPDVETVRHAVSIDERRRAYKPEYVDERRDHEQVWFSGVHSDVGGGFTDDSRLANITLRWMVDAAKIAGLKTTMLERVGPRGPDV